MPMRRLSTHPSNPAFTEVSGEVGRELIREQHTQAAPEPSEGNYCLYLVHKNLGFIRSH